MKKIFLVFMAVFAALFILITLTKKKEVVESTTTDSAYTNDERVKVLAFWAYYRQATDDRMEEQWEKAAENYKQALAINENHEDALYYLGNMYLELLRYKEAEACWNKLAQINPQKSRAFLQLGTLYLGNNDLFDIDKSESACRKALANNKEETGPLLLLGEIKLIRGQEEAAAADFKAVTTSNFKSTEAYFLGGYIAWKNGDQAKARDLFLTAVKYAKPEVNPAQKVEGEGDTKKGKGFGSVTSKSVFQKFMTGLPGVQPEQHDQALQMVYSSLDVFMAELKRKVH